MVNEQMENLTVEELLKYVDRSIPQVKMLAEALELELENHVNSTATRETVNEDHSMDDRFLGQ